MFTGLIEYKGRVRGIHHGKCSARLIIEAGPLMPGTELGDSIATNGVCLTVADMTADTFSADVMAETLRCSNLGGLVTGSIVNLERAMLPTKRMGGHLVTGHIDGTGHIVSHYREDNAVVVGIEAPAEVLRYIVKKGSVAIDGISLTVSGVDEQNFFVSIIPHTAGETTLLDKKIGDQVNLEGDLIGKYVEKMLGLSAGERGGAQKKSASSIDMGMLLTNGFLD